MCMQNNVMLLNVNYHVNLTVCVQTCFTTHATQMHFIVCSLMNYTYMSCLRLLRELHLNARRPGFETGRRWEISLEPLFGPSEAISCQVNVKINFIGFITTLQYKKYNLKRITLQKKLLKRQNHNYRKTISYQTLTPIKITNISLQYIQLILQCENL